MTLDNEIEKSNLEIRKDKDEVTKRVKDYLIRAHSFQEVGTERLPDKNYDILHFPHILLGTGVIMAIYGFYIILISSDNAKEAEPAPARAGSNFKANCKTRTSV